MYQVEISCTSKCTKYSHATTLVIGYRRSSFKMMDNSLIFLPDRHVIRYLLSGWSWYDKIIHLATVNVYSGPNL